MLPIFDKVQKHFNLNLPFVIYKKPNENNLIGFFQNTDELFLVVDFTEKGFTFCSFNGKKNILIPENQSEILIENFIIENFIIENNVKIKIPKIKSPESEIEKNNFENLVQNGINAINKNQFKKVVLSRVENIELFDFDLVTTFTNTINNYPSAFCYCFFHPQIGLWIGATPEQLLKINGNNLQTVSLAGTQKANSKNETVWQEKEINEQQFVTDFIVENLNQLGLKPQKTEPFTTTAGSLLHIKTIISTDLNDAFDLQKTINVLHPTPAVCGLPKQVSKEFIVENEGYNREFYTGFLGELNYFNQSDLFVNLRCMKIDKSIANIYVGCGITKDSIPELEWQETVNKSYTMKNNL